MKRYDTYEETVKGEYFNTELTRIFEIMKKHGYPKGGGSYLFDGYNLVWDSTTFEKQKLLFDTVKGLRDNPAIFEIGVYAGHSYLIINAAWEINYFGIDPMSYEFQKECLQPLDGLVEPSFSWQTLRGECQVDFDLVHIDGSHDRDDFVYDLSYFYAHAYSGLIIVDDWDGVGPQLPHFLKESINILKVADCRNPNALIQFK